MTSSKYFVPALFIVGVIVLAALVLGVIHVLSPTPTPVANPTVTVTATTTVTATATVTPAPPVQEAGLPCVTSRLRSAVVQDIQPFNSDGTFTLDVVLTNIGTASCTISGYPTVVMVGYEDGTQLGLPASKTGSPAASGTSTTLGPGESQAVQLAIDENDLYSQKSGCSYHSADGVRIIPPGQSAALYSPYDGLAGCTTTTLSVLTVGAFGNG